MSNQMMFDLSALADKPPKKTEFKTDIWKRLVVIKEITPEQADEIIETREPRGCFILKDGDVWVGIDNRDGDAWTEDFDSETKCRRWLRS